MPVIEIKLFNLIVDRSWAMDQSNHLSGLSIADLFVSFVHLVRKGEELCSTCLTHGFLDHFSCFNTLTPLAEHLLVEQTSLVAIWDIARHLLATN